MSDNSNERVLRELAEIKTLISWVGVGVFVLIITSDHHTPSWVQGLDWVLIIGGLVAFAVGCGVIALVGWCLWILVAAVKNWYYTRHRATLAAGHKHRADLFEIAMFCIVAAWLFGMLVAVTTGLEWLNHVIKVGF
ncbi:hypothetical protein ELI00_05285 [Rhizobium ruizarguesonis]|uniref:hypothetical protein n=1 Tax=Rhizobium ruizarguesonis TaxID=2081791 RepID=UPI001031ACA6|nr:hypothetical protein [Rhizobium ruizarguesonis]TAX75706.1 hypothetical protein ELI00_05285 [Rhizobium ruizarguesonis]